MRVLALTLSNVLKSYSFSCRESIPAANIRPSGSKLTTGRPFRCMRPWQLGERRSQRRIVRSREPERKVSLTGDIIKLTTLWSGRKRERQEGGRGRGRREEEGEAGGRKREREEEGEAGGRKREREDGEEGEKRAS